MAEQQKLEVMKLPPKATGEIGESGTLMYKGFLTNEEYNYDLTGYRAIQIYDIMRRSDPTVHALLTVIKNPIINADHDIEAGGDTPKDDEIKRFVKRELFERNLVWPDTTRQGLTAFDFGHAVFEKVYELTEFEGQPRIGIAKVASRKQRSIDAWEMRDGKPGIQQQINNNVKGKGSLVDIPRAKLIYVINELEGENWEGISGLRFCYKPWKIKDALEIMNAIALERMAVGIPKLKKTGTVQTISEPELQKARESLRQMRANEESYIELPEGLDVEMLDLKANSTKDVLPSIEHQNTQIMLSGLAQFLMLGSGESASGSRAVSGDHSNIFNKALGSVAKMWIQAIQNDLIKQLVDLNYTGVTNYPKYVINGIADDDVAIVSTAVSSLMSSGAISADRDVENRLRKMVGLPPMSAEDYENYEENHKVPALTPEDDEETGKDGKKKDTPKTTDKNEKDLEKKDKKTESSVLADAREARTRLFNQLVEA